MKNDIVRRCSTQNVFTLSMSYMMTHMPKKLSRTNRTLIRWNHVQSCQLRKDYNRS